MDYLITLATAIALASVLIAPYLVLRMRLRAERFPEAFLNSYLPWFALAFGVFAVFPTGSTAAPSDCVVILAGALGV